MLWVRIPLRARCTTLRDKVCQWLPTGQWFSTGTPVSSTNKTDRHDIIEILLKVALNTIKQANKQTIYKKRSFFTHYNVCTLILWSSRNRKCISGTIIAQNIFLKTICRCAIHLILNACIILPDFEKPLFRKEVQDVNSLKIGTVLTGKITNVTHFGAFVDIGVGQNGLIHTSKMKNSKVDLGDKVSVKVVSLDLNKNRIGLKIHGRW